MILVDASVWADHLRLPIPQLTALLNVRRILGHPCVRGEVSLGSIAMRQNRLMLLDELPQARVASHDEVSAMIEQRNWYSRGIGYVDAQLLASTLVTPEATLWTRDKRLAATAQTAGVAASLD